MELRTSDRQEPDVGTVSVAVHPRWRRRGAGTALLREAVRALVADGRHTAMVSFPEGAGVVRYSHALGLREALRRERALFAVGSADSRLLDRIAETEHPSYRLAAWVDAAPDDLLPSYAAARRAIGESPASVRHLDHADPDSTTLREYEKWTGLLGRERRVVAAVHEPTGEVAGLTEVSISARSPQWAWLTDTTVLPAHQGRGLDLWMKAEMARWLRADRPDVAVLCTYIPQSDVHMRRVNDRLGFRFDRWMVDYTADVFTLARRLGLAGRY